MSWLGQIRSHHRDETWSASLWQTFFAMSVGVHIPLLEEMPLSACGCKKFQLDALGDHLCTCTAHLGAKKAHDWAADQIADLFRTTHKVKTQQMARSRGQRCGDIELSVHLASGVGPVPSVPDFRIAHDRWGSSSDPSLDGHLHYPNDLDGPLNEAAADKNTTLTIIIVPLTLNPLCLLLQLRLGVYTVNLCAFYFCRLIGKLTAFLQLQEFSLHNPTGATIFAARRSPKTQIRSGTHPCQGCSTTH